MTHEVVGVHKKKNTVNDLSEGKQVQINQSVSCWTDYENPPTESREKAKWTHSTRPTCRLKNRNVIYLTRESLNIEISFLRETTDSRSDHNRLLFSIINLVV